MFEKLKQFFKGETGLDVDRSGEPSTEDLRTAVGVLLLEVSGRDRDYAPEEVSAMFSLMEDQFQIDPEEAKHYLELADAARSEKGKLDEFFHEINDAYTQKQRTRILAMAWKVLLADGTVEKEEARYVEQVRNRLRLSEDEAREAEQMARSGKV